MKVLGVLATFILFLCVTVAAPAYAQDRDESRPSQPQEEKVKDKDKDKDKHDDKAAKPGEPRQQPGMNQEERRNQPEAARPQEEKRPQEERKEQKAEERMERGNQQHPAHAQQGKRIPDDKFRASFGRQHTFHVQRTQIVNNPQPVIVYGGYSFQLIDPWPAEWTFEDDCYVDYVDGEYFLFDAFHPGIRIAVFVVG
jgi:type IV secretory pathway VirB10-like protein